MSRYILLPSKADAPGKQSYFLLPVEGFNQQVKNITLPVNLNPHNRLYAKVKDVGKLKRLLFKLSKTDIQRTKDGFVNDNDETVNVDYDHGIVSSCNGRFSSAFEKFYCLLRKHGITF